MTFLHRALNKDSAKKYYFNMFFWHIMLMMLEGDFDSEYSSVSRPRRVISLAILFA